jgi:hypothetical protein
VAAAAISAAVPGILSVLAVVTLRQDAAGADAGTLGVVGQALVASRTGRSCSARASSWVPETA